MLAALAFGVGLILFGFSRNIWFSLPMMLLTGMGMMVQMAASNTVLQTIVEESKRGRVMSLFLMAYAGMAPFGSLFGGFMADRVGASATLECGGIVCCLGRATVHARTAGNQPGGPADAGVPHSRRANMTRSFCCYAAVTVLLRRSVLAQAGSGAPATTAWHLTSSALSSACRAAIERTKHEVAAITAKPDAPGALDHLENAFADLQNGLGPHTFLFNVSPSAAVRDSSTACSQWVTNYAVEFAADPRVYAVAVRASTQKGLSPAERQLAKLYIEQGRHNGAALDSDVRARTTAMLQRLADVQREFMVALAADTSHITISKAELAGLSPQLAAGLKPDATGYAVPVNESTDADFMHTERSSDARRRFDLRYFNRGGAANIGRLEAAIALRDSLAHLFGFNSWAAYQLDVKMAKSPARVDSFLNRVDSGLLPKARAELARLTPLAAKDGISAPLAAWDIGYYNEQLRRTQYAVDGEQVRQYFPVDHVVRQVMDIYQELLGVRFTEILPADAWALGVREFAVKNAADGARLGVLYLDLFPRENKYGHFADFGLTSTRRTGPGTREAPVNAIVGNWPLGAAGEPATLTHDDVVTFFHEFGHAMSSVCDQSPFVTTGANDLRQDFVEALSQMLENWMWQPAVLARVSKNVTTGAPLPDSPSSGASLR